MEAQAEQNLTKQFLPVVHLMRHNTVSPPSIAQAALLLLDPLTLRVRLINFNLPTREAQAENLLLYEGILSCRLRLSQSKRKLLDHIRLPPTMQVVDTRALRFS